MGSGTTARAAEKLGRHYLGFEVHPEYLELS
jgi:DNA modification methylase